MAKEFYFQTSGDAEEDARIAAMIRKTEAMLDEGMCPNGCAPLVWDDPYYHHCPKCAYGGWTSTPYNGHPELYTPASGGEQG